MYKLEVKESSAVVVDVTPTATKPLMVTSGAAMDRCEVAVEEHHKCPACFSCGT